MKNFKEFILEFKQDMRPKAVVIIGGPGAGKTYWMSEHSKDHIPHWMTQSQYKKLFGSTNVSKRLDMDHNLEQHQKENCREIARIMLTAKRGSADKGWFDKFIKLKQQLMNEACEKGKSPKVDLSQIKWEFIEPWVEKINNARDKDRDRIMKDYYRAFKNEYWKKIFASDFSRRATSKKEYKQTYKDKFKGLLNIEDGEDIKQWFGPQDICLAICGDEIEKFEEVQHASDGQHAIYVIYLDIPVNMSIEADKNRDRSVGEKMVREKIADIHKVWEVLKKDFPKYDIYKLIHYETKQGKHPDWKLTELFINLNGKIKKLIDEKL